MGKSSNIYHNVSGFRYLQLVYRQSEDLCLTRCGIQQCKPTHSWGPRSRPQYHMHFILDGQGTLEIDNEVYHLSCGQIFLIPPNIMAHYYADNTTPWRYAFVSFIGDKAERYLNQAGFTPGVFVRPSNIPMEKFSSLIYEMLEAHQLTITNELKRIGTLFHLFALLTESNYALENPHNKPRYDYPSSSYLEHSLQFIQLNYDHAIQVSDIADYVGITRSYLFHIFKQNLNISPKDYLIHYRMDKAKQLLETSAAPIKDVATAVGYHDALAFSKMFRNVVGIPPSSYRRNFFKED